MSIEKQQGTSTLRNTNERMKVKRIPLTVADTTGYEHGGRDDEHGGTP